MYKHVCNIIHYNSEKSKQINNIQKKLKRSQMCQSREMSLLIIKQYQNYIIKWLKYKL